MAEASRKYRRLAGQVLVAGFHGQEPPDTLLRACRAGELGGVILFARNLTGDVADVAALVERLTVAAPDPLLVSIDQEGGRVQRLRAPVLQLPPMRVLGNIDDESLTRRARWASSWPSWASPPISHRCSTSTPILSIRSSVIAASLVTRPQWRDTGSPLRRGSRTPVWPPVESTFPVTETPRRTATSICRESPMRVIASMPSSWRRSAPRAGNCP